MNSTTRLLPTIVAISAWTFRSDVLTVNIAYRLLAAIVVSRIWGSVRESWHG